MKYTPYCTRVVRFLLIRRLPGRLALEQSSTASTLMMSAMESLISCRVSIRFPCTRTPETSLLSCFPRASIDLPVYSNLHSNPAIRNEEGFRKNVDDILTSVASVQQLEVRLKKLFTIYRKRNMKLSPSKFQVGHLLSLVEQLLRLSIRREILRRRYFSAPLSKS